MPKDMTHYLPETNTTAQFLAFWRKFEVGKKFPAPEYFISAINGVDDVDTLKHALASYPGYLDRTDKKGANELHLTPEERLKMHAAFARIMRHCWDSRDISCDHPLRDVCRQASIEAKARAMGLALMLGQPIKDPREWRSLTSRFMGGLSSRQIETLSSLDWWPVLTAKSPRPASPPAKGGKYERKLPKLPHCSPLVKGGDSTETMCHCVF